VTVAEFEQFLETHEQDVFTFCKHLAASHHTACDLYQETALAAFAMVKRLDTSHNPKAFLFAIAVGKWKNMRRKAARRQTIAPEIPLEQWQSTGGNSTEQAALDNLQQEAIHRAVNSLDDKFRIPLILHYFGNHPLEAIAQVCDIPAGTVKSRLHKARALLAKILQKEGFA